MGACPVCGATNPPGARFCNACGSPLAPAAPREERKTVTVVFADLVGFTSRAESLDPEDVLALVRPFHDLLRREVEAYGGTLARLVGDAGMAVFGYPTAHEDDPERAVRAALAIQAGLRALDEGTVALDLHARIGINTAEAVVTYGSALEDADDLMGDGVNAAARLQAIAPADTILVGRATRDATARTIRYAEAEPVVLRGRSVPTTAFRVLGPVATAAAPAPDATPFVGREAEVDLLVRAFERARGAGAVETVTIVADPGLGKSRLVRELGRRLDALPDLVTWRVGRCLPYGEGIGFWALGEIVRAQAGILDTDDRETRAARLEVALAEPDPALRRWMADRLAPLVGLPSATEPPTADEAFAAWRRFVASIAASGPAVLIVEDLHWADAAFVSFLAGLADGAVAAPLLIVVTARPEVAEQHPGWLARARRATVLPLVALDQDAMGRLVGAVLGAAGTTLRASVVARAEGSPLYAEQLAAMLRDRVAAGLQEVPEGEIPPSIHALLASRIDALPPEPRAVLLDASPVGKRFWPGAVAAVGGRRVEEVESVLADLVRRDLVRRVRPSSMAGEDEYAFWHALVRDVAYAALTRADRLARHRAVAAWIAALPGGTDGVAAELVAAHLERALELADALGEATTAAEIRPGLVTAHAASADHATRTEVPRAVEHLLRVLALLPRDDPRRPPVLVRLGRLYNSVNDVPAAVAAVEEGIAGLRAAGDDVRAAEAAPVLATALSFGGNAGRAHAVLAEARTALAGHPGPGLAALIAEQAIAEMNASRYDRARALADEAVALADSLGIVRPHRALHARGFVRYFTDPAGGEADFRASIDGAVDDGRILSAAGAMQNLAVARGSVVGPAAALAALDEAGEFRASHGLPGTPVLISRLDQLEIAGEWDAVLREAPPAREWAEAHGDAWAAWAADLVTTAVVLARGGRAAPAQALMDGGRAVGQAVFAAPVAAEAAIEAGDREGAKAILEAAIYELGTDAVERPAGFVRACIRCGAVDLGRRVLAHAVGAAPLEAAESLVAEGMIAEAAGDPGTACDRYTRGAAACGAMGMLPEQAHALEGLGRCLVAGREKDLGVAALREARVLWQRIGAPPRVAAIDRLLTSS